MPSDSDPSTRLFVTLSARAPKDGCAIPLPTGADGRKDPPAAAHDGRRPPTHRGVKPRLLLHRLGEARVGRAALDGLVRPVAAGRRHRGDARGARCLGAAGTEGDGEGQSWTAGVYITTGAASAARRDTQPPPARLKKRRGRASRWQLDRMRLAAVQATRRRPRTAPRPGAVPPTGSALGGRRVRHGARPPRRHPAPRVAKSSCGEKECSTRPSVRRGARTTSRRATRISFPCGAGGST